MEGAIPNLCDQIGYDKPLSLTFKNEGAPLFKFTKDEMSVKYNMIIEVYNEDYSQKYLDIHYENLFIKFKMYLEKNMTIFVDWENIEMDHAKVVPYIPLEDE